MRFRPAIAVLACAAATLAVPGAGSAAADDAAPAVATWTVATIPDEQGRPLQGEAIALACPAATWCQALTAYEHLTTIGPGPATTVSTPPVATDPPAPGSVDDLACPVVGRCFGVGATSAGPFDPTTGFRAVLRDGAWTATKGSAAYQQIACSTTQCVSIGTGDAGVDLASIDDRAAGGAWVTRTVQTPWQDSGFYVAVNGVACPPDGSCVVLGHAPVSFDHQPRPLFFYRSGSVWKGVPQALPAGADPERSAGAQQMSCPSSGNCVGLGVYADTAGQQHLFAETLRDGVLSAAAVPLPKSADGQAIAAGSLSCASTTSCAGWGSWSYERGDRLYHTVLLTYRDGAWAWQRAPLPAGAPAGARGFAADVSCASERLCVVVGKTANPVTFRGVRPVIWTERDGQWSARQLRLPAGVPASAETTLDHVVCAGATRCVATGSAGGTAYYATGVFSS